MRSHAQKSATTTNFSPRPLPRSFYAAFLPRIFSVSLPSVPHARPFSRADCLRAACRRPPRDLYALMLLASEWERCATRGLSPVSLAVPISILTLRSRIYLAAGRCAGAPRIFTRDNTPRDRTRAPSRVKTFPLFLRSNSLRSSARRVHPFFLMHDLSREM